jgi:hypothetical protein
VLTTWFIHQVFWIFWQKFRQAIALFRPGRVCLFSEYTPKSFG